MFLLSAQKHRRAQEMRSSSSVSRAQCSQTTKMLSLLSKICICQASSCPYVILSTTAYSHALHLSHSLKDMLYKRRMERQLAAARGEGPAPERAPDEVRNTFYVMRSVPHAPLHLFACWVDSTFAEHAIASAHPACCCLHGRQNTSIQARPCFLRTLCILHSW